MSSDTDEDHYHPSTRLIEIEKNSEQCGFHLTRSKWDPYPWVVSVDKNSAAALSGLRTGDCVLEANGEDVLGKRITEIAEIVKSNSEEVSLLLWNAGIDARCTSEALCCGPLPKHLQKLSTCVTTILAFLECPICMETISRPTYQCDNGHLICIRCRSKTERCPVCRIRLHKGRSLMADHILTTITDVFASLEDSEEAKLVKIQQIFKQKKKNKTLPEIKISESYTNKLISKIVGKSSSVDNLASSKHLTTSYLNQDNQQLPAKSRSDNEISISSRPALSKNTTHLRLSKSQIVTNNKDSDRPVSFHGSTEFMEKQLHLPPPEYGTFSSKETDTVLDGDRYHSESYYCPFVNNCSAVLRSVGIFDHFIKEHSNSGPLIQYFSDDLQLFLKDFKENREYCSSVFSQGQTFFVKLKLQSTEVNQTGDILLWVWHLGCKMSSRNYGAQIEIKNVVTEETLLKVRSSVFSLSAVSPEEVMKSKKGVYLSGNSIEALGFQSNELFLGIRIFENET